MGGGQRFPFQRGSCRFVEVIQKKKGQDRERVGEVIASDQENIQRQSKRKARKEV